MTKPETIIMSGYGINCERETAYSFQYAGCNPKIIHINDLIADQQKLDKCKILVWPGGFSMGDDTGSGLAYANLARDKLGDAIKRFIERDTLSIGICNGFQIMMHLGFFPIGHKNYGVPETALTFNTTARYRDLWVNLINIDKEKCAWTKGIDNLFLPIAHGEGRFYADKDTMEKLRSSGQIVFKYEKNPNGSLDDIAGICDPSGRFLGMMPHPERAILLIQDPYYTLKREQAARKGEELAEKTNCTQIFHNAVKYFG